MKHRVRPGHWVKMSGFTLIELLVVMAIIGVLISLVAAGLHELKIVAAKTKSAQTLNNMATGIHSLKMTANKSGFIATGWVDGSNCESYISGSGTFIKFDSKTQINEVVKNEHMGRELAPGDSRMFTDASAQQTWVATKMILNTKARKTLELKAEDIRTVVAADGPQVVDYWENPIHYLIIKVVDDAGNDVWKRREILYSMGPDDTDNTFDGDNDSGDDIVRELSTCEVSQP